jgi:uncharacterized protein (DUF433 family)
MSQGKPKPSQSSANGEEGIELSSTENLRTAEDLLLQRITVDPEIFSGKPIIRGRRLAVEHVLGMLAAGDSVQTLLEQYSFLEEADIRACLAYAHRVVGHERIDPPLDTSAA